jgi:hypothetical protein
MAPRRHAEESHEALSGPRVLIVEIYSINFGSYIMRFMNIVQRERALHIW